MLLVWRVNDGDDWTAFVAAPTRGTARWWTEAEYGDHWSGDGLRYGVRRVKADGTIGGRGEQAAVEAVEARELTTEECAALGWRECEECGRWTREPEGFMCQDCAEWADEGVRA